MIGYPLMVRPSFILGGAGTGIADDERLGRVLHDYFSWATNTTMSRYDRAKEDVPAGLSIPRWSWDGLVDEG